MSAEPITPEALVELLLPRVTDALLAFDVDGVLAPLVAHADEAKLSEGVADALAILAGRHHVALLSGRSLGSLSRLLDFPDGLHVIGSHGLGGLERWLIGSVAEKVVRGASCPVVVVKPPGASGSPSEML